MLKSLLGRGREKTPLQLYGKLPLAKDYLRIACGEDGGRELREWLDEGFGAARDASEEVRLAEPLRFIGEAGGDALQGFLWPSSDSGEKRRFPFTLFVARRPKSLLADLDARLSEAEGVWRQLAEVRERCAGFSEGRELLDRMRGEELEVHEEDAVPAAFADYTSWLEACWPDEGEEGLHEVLRTVGALASARHAGPYRLPLVRELPLRDQVLGWLTVLRSLDALPAEDLPTLFFPQPSMLLRPDRAFLVAAPKRLAPADVRWLEACEDAEAPLGEGDFCAGRDEIEGPAAPPEASTSLRDALKRAVDAHRS